MPILVRLGAMNIDPGAFADETGKAAGTAGAPPLCLNRRRPSRRPLTGG